VQHEAVDVAGAEMLQRTGQRLRDLLAGFRLRIVGQRVILPRLTLPAGVGELGLQKQVVAGDDAGLIGGSQAFAHSGLEVVAALIGGVDGAKSRAQREFGERGGAVFFPGSAVEKSGRLR
jgi:hypothetical protein